MPTAMFRPLLMATVLILAAGCSRSDRPTLGTVTGTVTLGGAPLANALVLFTPEGPGRTSLGSTGPDGTYTLTFLRDIMGANLGRHRVRITTATEENGRRELLPAKYHAKSTLTADVAIGANTIDFPLTAK